MLPRRDRLVEISNLFRARENVFRTGGTEADRLGKLEAALTANLEQIASILGASPEDVAQAVDEATASPPSGGVPGVAPFGAHPYVVRHGSANHSEGSEG